MPEPIKPLLAVLCAACLAANLSACGSTVSTSTFKGAEREVAQAVANLQTDVRAAEEQKVCANDLSQTIVARLNQAPGGCKEAIKTQLVEVDNPEMVVESVKLSGSQATASVKSVYGGKSRVRTLSLVKEGGTWKISGLM